MKISPANLNPWHSPFSELIECPLFVAKKGLDPMPLYGYVGFPPHIQQASLQHQLDTL